MDVASAMGSRARVARLQSPDQKNRPGSITYTDNVVGLSVRRKNKGRLGGRGEFDGDERRHLRLGPYYRPAGSHERRSDATARSLEHDRELHVLIGRQRLGRFEQHT